MIEPATGFPDAPTITIASKKWPVPELAPKQLRKVRRTLLNLNAAIQSADNFRAFIDGLTDQQYGDLVDIAYHGLTKAHPALTYDEFCEWKISDSELLNAFFVVRDQSGLFVKREPNASEDDAPGEAMAEGSQIGTES